MAVTIKDVARESGVSVATVSRAINGQGSVSPPVRQRVLEVARRLDYAPHEAARALSSRRTRTVGVVLPDLHGEFFSELIRGIGQEARAHGMHLLLSSDHGDAGGQGVALQAMRGRVDGVLVMAPTDAGMRSLSAHLSPGLPAVLINGIDGEGRWPAVAVDGYGGARTLVGHLLETGCRRIAFIAGPDDNHDARERRRGCEDELAGAAQGTAFQVLPGRFDEASGVEAAHALLATGPLPDAVFAANDAMAIGCLQGLADAGVDVPGRVAVAGFDDIPLARYVRPALTTIRVDIAELGARALRVLIGIESGPATDLGLVRGELIVRGSTSCQRVHTIDNHVS